MVYKREAGILRRAERAVMRVMCGDKSIDKKNTKELMEMMDLNGSNEMVANANVMQWYGHVLK